MQDYRYAFGTEYSHSLFDITEKQKAKAKAKAKTKQNKQTKLIQREVGTTVKCLGIDQDEVLVV